MDKLNYDFSIRMSISKPTGGGQINLSRRRLEKLRTNTINGRKKIEEGGEENGGGGGG